MHIFITKIKFEVIETEFGVQGSTKVEQRSKGEKIYFRMSLPLKCFVDQSHAGKIAITNIVTTAPPVDLKG